MHILNDAAGFKQELIEGFVAANAHLVARVPNASGVMARGAPRAGKVSVLIGGGSGHYPAFAGYVGEGLADGAAMGEIFASPSAEQIYRCTRAIDGGAGVLYAYGNYSGDVMNFNLAQARCRAEGIDVRSVRVCDDVASAPADQRTQRRGIAGDLFVFKVAGAAAARGATLDEVEALARRANERTRSFGVAFGGCTLPGQPQPLFSVEPGRMELGLGVHGEPGIESSALLPAAEIARLLVQTVLADAPADAPADAGARVAVLLNGLGSTTHEELFVLYGAIDQLLASHGLAVHNTLVGELVTSLNMEGCSLSLLWLDDALQPLWDAPAEAPAFVRR